MTYRSFTDGSNVQSRVENNWVRQRKREWLFKMRPWVPRPALQNGLLATTPTERRKASNRLSHLQGKWPVEGRDTREHKAKKLSPRKIKHGPMRTSIASVFAPSTSHCAVASYLWVHCCHTSHFTWQNVNHNFPTWSHLDSGYPDKPRVPTKYIQFTDSSILWSCVFISY